MNVIWCFFNVVILGVCTAVAREMKQLRTTVRIMRLCRSQMPDGPPISGQTIEIVKPHKGTTTMTANPRGDHRHVVGRRQHSVPRSSEFAPETQVWLSFPHPAPSTEIPAHVVSTEGSVLRLRFEDLTIAEQEVLTMVLYSRADSWLGWGEPHKKRQCYAQHGQHLPDLHARPGRYVQESV